LCWLEIVLKKVKHVLATTLEAEAQLWLAEGQMAKAKAKHKSVYFLNESTLVPLMSDLALISWIFTQNIPIQLIIYYPL
jgi:hypothetical protein